VLVFDLDGMKRFNDSDGHAGGPIGRSAACRYFTLLLSIDCTAARYGGDEFESSAGEQRKEADQSDAGYANGFPAIARSLRFREVLHCGLS